MARVIFSCGKCKESYEIKCPVESIRCDFCNSLNRLEYDIKCWIGFNYRKYEDLIIEYLEEEKFELLKATTKIEEIAGKLTVEQVEKLRQTLKKGIKNNWTMQKIADEIHKNVKPQDLFEIEGDDLALNKNGEPKLIVSKEFRPIAMARSEIVRASNQGALKHYAQGGIEKVRWIATISNRTCPLCIEKNGLVMTVQEAYENAPPLHSLCRCVLAPITQLA